MKVASYEKAEWIDPWRDRRPMTDDLVLVTYWHDTKLRVDTACYTKKRDIPQVVVLDTEGWKSLGTVLAWKPLPEPYDPTAEEEENPFADAVTVTLYPMDKEAGYEN